MAIVRNGQCHRKQTARKGDGEKAVQETTGAQERSGVHGKPSPEQDQIGNRRAARPEARKTRLKIPG